MSHDTQVKQEAPPNHALVQLLEAALLHPESAEGSIRQVIESLGVSAPIVAPVVDNKSCPFCNDTDFDLPGLKHHLLSSYCDVFQQTPTLDDAVAERLRNAQMDIRDCEGVKRQC